MILVAVIDPNNHRSDIKAAKNANADFIIVPETGPNGESWYTIKSLNSGMQTTQVADEILTIIVKGMQSV